MLSQKKTLKWKVLLVIALLLNYVYFLFYFFPQLRRGNEIPFSFLVLPHLELSKIKEQSDGDDIKNKK